MILKNRTKEHVEAFRYICYAFICRKPMFEDEEEMKRTKVSQKRSGKTSEGHF